jgi:hypothetical protein
VPRSGTFKNFFVLLTPVSDQTNHSKNFERFALQTFQNFYWFWFERKALHVKIAISAI